MRYLSLFTGAGGGDLAFQHLLGWECMGYVEWDSYCQRVIAQRQTDGVFDCAPIYGDVRAFARDGYAAAYTGMVDVVTGGFPCQPFSVAGKRAGADDERNMWPATIECIRTIRPQFAFLENVPGLLSSGYFEIILGDLAESGYDVRWRVLSAAEVGAPHKRDRLWIVAHAARGQDNRRERGVVAKTQGGGESGDAAIVAGSPHVGYAVGDGRTAGRQDYEQHDGHIAGATSQHAGALAHATTIHVQRRDYRQGQGEFRGSSWWSVEPRLGRVADGVADRVNRLKAIGNGIVPAVAATAWHLLTEELCTV